MDEKRIVEYPQIRYHISYDKNLALKDLEDILRLLRISNNDVLCEMGVPRSKSNDLQRIDSIEPGSINLIAILKELLSMTASAFSEKSIDRIKERIKNTRAACDANPKLDKPIFCKCKVEVKSGEQTILIESNAQVVNIEIRVHNAEDNNLFAKLDHKDHIG